jgi:hypothetical protein
LGFPLEDGGFVFHIGIGQVFWESLRYF